jgi:hypothetical protein
MKLCRKKLHDLDSPNGRINGQCRLCANLNKAAWKKANKPAPKRYLRACLFCGVECEFKKVNTRFCSPECYRKHYGKENRKRIVENAKIRREANPAEYKTYQRNYVIRRHEISEQEYQQLTEEQNNRCALCIEEFIKNPHIDHSHLCIKNHSKNHGCAYCIRGLLCGICNRFRVIGVEFLSTTNVFCHPYLSRRPILAYRGLS